MAWGGNEKPLVFSSPGAHCCLTFCRQTFKGSFLFCTGGVAYREGRIALPAWRVDPSPTWCSAGPAIQAQLCPTDLSPAPGFNYSDSASFPRGWEMQYAWECLCYRRQDSPAGTEGQFGEGEGSAWHRCAQNWSILGGRIPRCDSAPPAGPGRAVMCDHVMLTLSFTHEIKSLPWALNAKPMQATPADIKCILAALEQGRILQLYVP